MLTLTKVFTISTDILERLFEEARPYISAERQRMGEESLKSELFQFYDLPIIKYDYDGYTVGICSYNEHNFNGKKYLFHRHPIYGQTQTGSRAWWYSEEFQQKNSEYVIAEGFAGVITLFNPDSPAGRAVGTHFGSFNKYYERPVVYTNPEDIGILLKPDAINILQAYVIDIKVD